MCEWNTHLQHGVAVGIGNMYLQTSKLSVIVMAKVKCLNAYNARDDNAYLYTIGLSKGVPSLEYLISTCR